MRFPKATIVRSEPYRRYVSQQECFGCRVEGFTQVAHPNKGKGLAMKTCDLSAFPLCGPHWGMPGCHFLLDNTIDMTRDQRRELEAKYTAEMQARARADGRLEFKEAA